jgi:protein TonB
MHISKFDLYRTEWLDLVFDDRNKEYGAYDLRKHYAGNLVKAMGIAFAGIALLFIGCAFLFKHIPVEITKVVPITLNPRIVVITPKVEHPKPQTTIVHPPAPTVANPPMVVAPDPESKPPVTIDDLAGKNIGPVTTQGTGTTTIDVPPVTQGTGTSSQPAVDNGLHDVTGLDVMPEPFGGTNAWSKFLQKNIHYPNQAVDAGVQGKVWITFIIEKDGHLSNITVEKGVGSGLDDEALRVLKLAPAWKPGKQNGQPVRVKYSIPINFILPDNG